MSRSLLLAVSTMLACSAQAPPAPELQVWFTGCDVVDHGAACTPTSKELVLWSEATDLQVSVRGLPTSVQTETAHGGQRVRFPMPADEGELPVNVVVEGIVDGETQRWTLQLVDNPHAARDQELAANKHTAGTCLDPLLQRLSTASVADRGAIHRAIGTCHRSGQRLELYLESLANAIDGYGVSGEVTQQHRAIAALSYNLGKTADGRERVPALLERIGPTTHGESAFIHDNRLGSWHQRQGRYRQAMAAWQTGMLTTARLDMTKQRQGLQSQLARLATDLGDLEHAIDLQQALVEATPLTEQSACPPPVRAHYPARRAENLAWIQLMQAEITGELDPAHTPALTLAKVRAYSERCAQEDEHLSNLAVNQALADVYGGRLAEARNHLDRARPMLRRAPVRVRTWHAEITARVALAEGDVTGAVASWEEELALVDEGGTPAERMQALTGLAEAKWANAHPEEALLVFEEAHDVLWSAVSEVPLQADRARFLAARNRLTRRHVQLLVQLDRAPQALVLVRTARARALASLQSGHRLDTLRPHDRRRYQEHINAFTSHRTAQRTAREQRWKLSEDQLAEYAQRQASLQRQAGDALNQAMSILPTVQVKPPREPEEGELMLTWFPHKDGWIGFAQTAEGVWVHDVPAGDGLDRFVQPFAQQIRSADRIALLPWGALWTEPLHTASVDGRPLIAHAPVVWALDVHAGVPSSGGDLIVSDPTADLPEARAEGHNVQALWQGAAHVHGERATVSAVSDAMVSAGRLHYAGHGRFAADVWATGLPLHDGVLAVSDVLAMPAVPSEVVLSGCETGRVRSASTVASLGIAQAFVVAGSHAVVATDRNIDDADAADIVSALHDAQGPLAERLRQAQLQLAATRPEADWQAWRVWTP